MFKRALLLRTISHYMFRLLIKPSSGVSKHRILKVAVTDPLLSVTYIVSVINFNNGSITATFSILCLDTLDDGLIRSRNM
jgi:hypothetical protein